jgi:hypothetical protein
MAPAPALAAPPLPATEDRPEYAGYPIRYSLVERGHYPLVSGDTVEELWALPWSPDATVIAQRISPYGMPVVTRPMAGGTWHGARCASLRWVVDTGDVVQRAFRLLNALSDRTISIQDGPVTEDAATMSQAWWVNGVRTREEHGWDGFYVQCLKPTRHEEPCQVRDWVWDGRALTVIA